jgi:hypothetical protein
VLTSGSSSSSRVFPKIREEEVEEETKKKGKKRKSFKLKIE